MILLLKTVTSLKQLYAMSMDVHSRQEKKRAAKKQGFFVRLVLLPCSGLHARAARCCCVVRSRNRRCLRLRSWVLIYTVCEGRTGPTVYRQACFRPFSFFFFFRAPEEPPTSCFVFDSSNFVVCFAYLFFRFRTESSGDVVGRLAHHSYVGPFPKSDQTQTISGAPCYAASVPPTDTATNSTVTVNPGLLRLRLNKPPLCFTYLFSRFRTESSGDVVGRFNERFMLTLGDCKSCLVCDDELNVLPLSSHARDIVPLPPVDGEMIQAAGPCHDPSRRERCLAF